MPPSQAAIVGEVIKQGVADPPAKKDAERREHDHVVDVIGTEGQGLHRRRSLDEQVRGREADQVHQPIPTELERTEFKKDRIDIGKGNCGE
jgi:hypothetical protein